MVQVGVVMACDADIKAGNLYGSLAEAFLAGALDKDFSDAKYSGTPPASMSEVVTKLDMPKLTTGTIDGTGAFDKLMIALSAHLKSECDKNRITGAEYTKAYLATLELALTQGSSYLLNAERQYWETLTAQQNAKVAATQASTALIQLETAKAQYSVTKLQVENLLADAAVKKLQLAKMASDVCAAEYTLENILPKQSSVLEAQVKLTNEQYESARAQTMDTRSNGTAVAGTIGAQKDLHKQQVIAYQQDSKTKVAKIFTDAWITQKTLDDLIPAPQQFTNPEVDEVLTAVRTMVGI